MVSPFARRVCSSGLEFGTVVAKNFSAKCSIKLKMCPMEKYSIPTALCWVSRCCTRPSSPHCNQYSIPKISSYLFHHSQTVTTHPLLYSYIIIDTGIVQRQDIPNILDLFFAGLFGSVSAFSRYSLGWPSTSNVKYRYRNSSSDGRLIICSLTTPRLLGPSTWKTISMRS